MCGIFVQLFNLEVKYYFLNLRGLVSGRGTVHYMCVGVPVCITNVYINEVTLDGYTRYQGLIELRKDIKAFRVWGWKNCNCFW